MKNPAAGAYWRLQKVDFDVSDLPSIAPPDSVLFVRPTYFQVDYVINPHMEGRVGTVDTAGAQREWHKLVDAYRELGLHVHELEGQPGLPDMVFCANQSLPALGRDGSRKVLLSKMANDERSSEVAFFERFFGEQRYDVLPAPDAPFEGMGDALWQPGRRLLWLGTGYRSDAKIVETVAGALDAPAIALRLVDPDLYHLDTCLSFLNATTALWVPSAFDEYGREIIRGLIPNLLDVPINEAKSLLACNAHCVDGHNVVIQAGCAATIQLLQERGFEVVECETGEFLKSGGSVFCMKQMFWSHETV